MKSHLVVHCRAAEVDDVYRLVQAPGQGGDQRRLARARRTVKQVAPAPRDAVRILRPRRVDARASLLYPSIVVLVLSSHDSDCIIILS